MKWVPEEACGCPQSSLPLAPRKRGATPPPTLAGVRHLPDEAATGGRGSAARKGKPSPGPLGVRPGPAAREGTRGRRLPPGAAEPARGLARGPLVLPRTRPRRAERAAASAQSAEPRGGGRSARTCPAPCGSPANGFTHLAPSPRLPHVTARLRAPQHQQPGSRQAPGDPALPPSPPLPPAWSSGRRQRTCCVACHGRLGSAGAASAPQQHGGRGLRRKPGGGEVGAGPGSRRPARCRAPTPHPWEPETARAWLLVPRVLEH
nr:collagen alpha-1(I) chain-like [Saimiri boliviensis boliviensis]